MREKEPERRRPIALIIALLATCLFLAVCALIYVGESRRYRGTKPELLNVWYGEHKNVIKIAADGSGSGYIESNPPQFFRWSESKGTFRIYFEPRDKPMLMIVGQFVADLCGQPSSSESYRIESLTGDTLRIVDERTGDVILFSTNQPQAPISDKK